MDIPGKFYLGRVFDQQKSQVTENSLLYRADDLTTHAVVVGMTGSGKTGLCIDLLEEAALNSLPALMIDPKGDITNALLHFPDLLPQDFQPWLNPDQVRRSGKTLDAAAVDTAATWQKGLADWGIGPDRIRLLQSKVDFAIYTPGSDAGLPVSILASLQAPTLPWEENRELLREKISGTVTALLGLVGLNNIDPVRSREHILLANIFENAWKQGKDLDLSELILQTQSPPFPKLGVFDVNTFFPQKDRFELAMMLNNILASPAFQAWIEGQPLDIPSLLYTPQGRPRHSVFYIAHLTDTERMFFVTLLYSAVESWMRAQSGTTSLRALLYFDEIFGYMPPLGNPPSKQPMLRMLKQARAFGVGQVLVSQNPVDIDYKALSNTGTWMIGKLQTDQDKQRLLDGLEGAMAGNLDRGQYDRLISGLAKRVFLLHNVNESGPALFQTRWAMNYLAGPLTRTQIPAANALVGAGLPAAGPVQATAGSGYAPAPQQAPAQPTTRETRPAAAEKQSPANQAGLTSATRPALPAGIDEYFLPNNLSFSEGLKATRLPVSVDMVAPDLVYKPALIGQARIRFINRKYNLDYEAVKGVRVENPDRRGVVRWENFPAAALNPRQLDDRPAPQSRFMALEAPLNDAKGIAALRRDFLDWAYRTGGVSVRANETLKVYAGPEVSPAEFRTQCAEAARDARDAELEKTSAAYEKKLAALQNKLDNAERDLETEESELSSRKWEEMGTAAENVFGMITGRKSSRRISSSLSKRRQTSKAKAEVEEAKDLIADLKKQIADLEKEKEKGLADVQDRWGDLANQVTEIPVAPLKKDVLIDLFGVAWLPTYQVRIGTETFEIPGFSES